MSNSEGIAVGSESNTLIFDHPIKSDGSAVVGGGALVADTIQTPALVMGQGPKSRIITVKDSGEVVVSQCDSAAISAPPGPAVPYFSAAYVSVAEVGSDIQSVFEGSLQDFRAISSSGHTVAHTWSGTIPDGLQLSASGALTGTPTKADTFTWTETATSSSGGVTVSSTQTFTMLVLPQLVAPTWSSPVNFELLQGSPAVVTVSATAGSSTVTYSPGATLPVNTSNAVNQGPFMVVANTSNQLRTLSTRRDFYVNVVPLVPPTWSKSASTVNFRSGDPVRIDLTGMLQPPSATIKVTTGYLGAGANTVMSSMVYTSGTSATTNGQVVFRATTTNGFVSSTAYTTFVVTVTPPLAALAWAVNPVTVLNPVNGVTFTYDLTGLATSAYTSPIVYSVSSNPNTNITLSVVNGVTLTGMAVLAQGDPTFYSNVTLAASQSGQTTVQAQAVIFVATYVPAWPSGYTDIGTIAEGDTINQQLDAVVAGGATINYSLVSPNLAGGLSASGTTFSGYVTEVNSGYQVVRASVTVSGVTMYADKVFGVTAMSIVPVWQTSSNLGTASARSQANYTLVATSATPRVTYAMSSLSPASGGLTISPEGVMSGTIVSGSTQTFTIAVVATATNGVISRTSSRTFTLNVVNAVLAPVWGNTASAIVVLEGSSVSVALNATSPSGDSITFALLSPILGGALAISGAMLTGYFTAIAFGTQVVTAASTRDGITSTSSLMLQVSAESITPVWQTDSYLGNVATGTQQSYTLVASSKATSAVTYSGSMPSGYTLSSSGVLTGSMTVTSTQTLSFAVTASATNGPITRTSQLTFNLTIDGPPPPPPPPTPTPDPTPTPTPDPTPTPAPNTTWYSLACWGRGAPSGSDYVFTYYVPSAGFRKPWNDDTKSVLVVGQMYHVITCTDFGQAYTGMYKLKAAGSSTLTLESLAGITYPRAECFSLFTDITPAKYWSAWTGTHTWSPNFKSGTSWNGLVT